MGMGMELFAQRKNGTQFPVEIGLNPIPTHSGLSVIATIADISQRKQLEKNFKQIINAAPIGMLMVDTNGLISLVNPYLTSLFGYSEAELIGQTIEMLLPEQHRQNHTQVREQYLNNPVIRQMGPGLNLTGQHKNGKIFPLEIGLNPIETEQGVVIIAAITDVSEQKKMEQDLRQANSNLDEFTYVVSHDLKSPLRGIASLIEWIEEDLGNTISDDVKHNLHRIDVRIQRMGTLIEDLLAYAHAGEKRTNVAKIHLPTLIENVIALINPQNTFEISVECQIDHIVASTAPLETILRNLISNAMKHHDQDTGKIQILVKPEQDSCIFSITDDGPGIPAAAHQNIFKLFQTLSHDAPTRTGIGLAIVKRLIEANNGRIEIESNEHQRGATFHFWWPYLTEEDRNA